MIKILKVLIIKKQVNKLAKRKEKIKIKRKKRKSQRNDFRILKETTMKDMNQRIGKHLRRNPRKREKLINRIMKMMKLGNL